MPTRVPDLLTQSTLNIADVPVMSAGPVQSSDTSTAQVCDCLDLAAYN